MQTQTAELSKKNRLKTYTVNEMIAPYITQAGTMKFTHTKVKLTSSKNTW